MGVIIRSSCFGCLLLAFILQGAVCQDDRCQTLVSIVVTIGHNRKVHCNVSCENPRRIEWGQQGSDGLISQGSNYVIQDVRNTSIGGTVYWCQCPGDDRNRQCFKILVSPHIFEFIAEPSEVTVGSAFDLICKAEGYPAPHLQNFTLGTVGPNILLPQTYHPVPSGVDVTVPNVTMEYMGNYSCVVTVGSELHTTSTTARVTVYEPPKLRSIKNFTMSNAVADQSAVLECIIESTPSSEVVMEWRRNGILLGSGWKYVNWTLYSDDGSNLLVAILVVRNVSNDDLGAYECRLYSNYSYLRNRSEGVVEAWIMADVPNTPTTEGIKECDCNSQYTGAVVAAVLEPVVIIATVIAIVVGITRWRKHSSSRDVGVTQDEQGMDNGVQLANPNVNPPIPQNANNVPPGEGQVQPAQDGQERNRNQNLDAIQSPAEVARNEQEIYQHANSCVILPMDPIRSPVEAQSATVPPTGEDDVQPAHGVQERDAIPPPPSPPLPPPPANAREATTNNQPSDRVGDGSVQLRRPTPDSDSPTLDKEEHFVPAPKASVRWQQSLPQERPPFNEELQSQATIGALKPRRGSHSSRDDPDVRRGSVPALLSPLVQVVSASPQSPRSPNKKRKFSISSSSKRQSQIEDGEKTNLLKGLSPVDDEHLGDGHTSDDP